TCVADELTRAISFEKVAPPSVEKATIEVLTASLSVAVNGMMTRVPAVIKPPPLGVITLTLGAIVSIPRPLNEIDAFPPLLVNSMTPQWRECIDLVERSGY